MINKGQGRAHGKIILIGEHAVVYEQAAIALPFPAVHVEANIQASDSAIQIRSDFFNGPLKQAADELKSLQTLIYTFLRDYHKEEELFELTINSQIPIGRGLGSSAAVASAVIRALFDYFQLPSSTEQCLHYVDLSEKINHGQPSGLDAQISLMDQAIYYVKNQEMTPFTINLENYLVVADTGQVGRTKETVADVRVLLAAKAKQAPAHVEALGRLSQQSYTALKEGKAKVLGQCMTQAHHHLQALTVSNSKLDQLVSTALKEGALGAKLTGGGRGGCMIALSENKKQASKIAQALQDQHAQTTWIYQLKTGEDYA